MNIARFVTLSFIPRSTDCALLLLRAWLGSTIFYAHGWDKLRGFSATVSKFGEMGFPAPLAAAAIISESVCAVLLVIGLATRWSAAFLATTMAVAFVKAHQMALKGPGSGELAFLYLAGFLTILIAGAGRWSVDNKLAR